VLFTLSSSLSSADRHCRLRTHSQEFWQDQRRVSPPLVVTSCWSGSCWRPLRRHRPADHGEAHGCRGLQDYPCRPSWCSWWGEWIPVCVYIILLIWSTASTAWPIDDPVLTGCDLLGSHYRLPSCLRRGGPGADACLVVPDISHWADCAYERGSMWWKGWIRCLSILLRLFMVYLDLKRFAASQLDPLCYSLS